MSSHFILGIFDWQFRCCNKFAYLARFSMGLHNRHHVYTHHKRIAPRCSDEMGWETERYGMETKWNGGLSSSHGRVVNATRRDDLLFYCGAQFVTHNSATVCMFVCVWRVCVAGNNINANNAHICQKIKRTANATSFMRDKLIINLII